MIVRQAEARDLAVRIAGANHSRRLYGIHGASWERTLEGLKAELDRRLEASGADELTIGLLGEGLAVMGVPIGDPPSSVLRLMGQLSQRDVEIVTIHRGCTASELDNLFAFLGEDPADIAAVHGDTWLRERGVDSIRIKHLSFVRGSGIDSFRDVYWRSKKVLDHQFKRASERGVVHLGAVHELARGLMDVVLASETPVATLLALRDRDDFALIHSVNVATLVAAQAGALGMSEDDVERLVTVALVHDIGKTRVPEAILQKRDDLTDQERALLDRHTAEGARLLVETAGADALPAVVALQHHQKPNPDEPRLLAVEITRIADVFDGIRTLAPFDDRAGMHAAVSYMATHMPGTFNGYLLERFGRLVGACAQGDTVALSTGELASVIDPHPELAFHPAVEIIETGSGQLAARQQVDLSKFADDPRCPVAVPLMTTDLEALKPAQIEALG